MPLEHWHTPKRKPGLIAKLCRCNAFHAPELAYACRFEIEEIIVYVQP